MTPTHRRPTALRPHRVPTPSARALAAATAAAAVTLLGPTAARSIPAAHSTTTAQAPTAVQPVRGVAGDLWADTILGQPDFHIVTPNKVVANRLFNPNGVLVDRTVQPNRVYVYDAGNNRVLGLRHLGTCAAGPSAGGACTSNADCPGSTCFLDRDKPADIVLGQTSLAGESACNGDSAFQSYPVPPAPSASTLCLLRVDQLSILEGGSAATMAVDPAGNLYVPDFFNHRVLRYDRPFETDAVADHVWGQADFNGQACNRGRGSTGPPDAESLCLAPPNGHGTIEAGVAVDGAGNLWVTDKQNHRVLRFPRGADGDVPAPTADLVLGQGDLVAHGSSADLAGLNAPGAVRVDERGTVYVADTYNSRVLAYEPPLRSGMPAGYTLGSGMDRPPGLEIGPDGDLWVNDAFNRRLVRFRGRNEVQALGYFAGGDWGGPGIDRDGNVLQSGWTHQALLHHPAPPPNARSIEPDAFLLSSARNVRMPNEVDGGRLFVVNGMTIAGDQLIVADQDRLLFWNRPWDAVNGQPADGVVGQPDAVTMSGGGDYFGRLDAEFVYQNIGPPPAHLWALHSAGGATLSSYVMPLTASAQPSHVLRSPVVVDGGSRSFHWSASVAIGDLAVDVSGNSIWVSDRDFNRVFRIANVQPAGVPSVDVVLGQANDNGRACNRGRGSRAPAQDSLCAPGGLAFQGLGNLVVADHAREFDGNHRLLLWDGDRLPTNAQRVTFGIPASRVFGRQGSFEEPDCRSPLCGPFDPAFFGKDGQVTLAMMNRMVVGVNPYIGGLNTARFPLLFDDVLADGPPRDTLRDYFSMSLQGAFDRYGNLYMSDHNRSRILIYRDPFGDGGGMPSATPTPTATTAETAVPTATAIASRIPSQEPTPTLNPTSEHSSTPSPAPRHRIYMPYGSRHAPIAAARSDRPGDGVYNVFMYSISASTSAAPRSVPYACPPFPFPRRRVSKSVPTRFSSAQPSFSRAFASAQLDMKPTFTGS